MSFGYRIRPASADVYQEFSSLVSSDSEGEVDSTLKKALSIHVHPMQGTSTALAEFTRLVSGQTLSLPHGRPAIQPISSDHKPSEAAHTDIHRSDWGNYDGWRRSNDEFSPKGSTQYGRGRSPPRRQDQYDVHWRDGSHEPRSSARNNVHRYSPELRPTYRESSPPRWRNGQPTLDRSSYHEDGSYMDWKYNQLRDQYKPHQQSYVSNGNYQDSRVSDDHNITPPRPGTDSPKSPSPYYKGTYPSQALKSESPPTYFRRVQEVKQGSHSGYFIDRKPSEVVTIEESPPPPADDDDDDDDDNDGVRVLDGGVSIPGVDSASGANESGGSAVDNAGMTDLDSEGADIVKEYRDAVKILVEGSSHSRVDVESVTKMTSQELANLDMMDIIDGEIRSLASKFAVVQQVSDEARSIRKKHKRITDLLKSILSHGLGRDIDDADLDKIKDGSILPSKLE